MKYHITSQPSSVYKQLKSVCMLMLIALARGPLAQAQELPEEWIQSLINADEDAPANTDALYDFYAGLLRRPLHLNRAQAEDLQQLRLLSDQQIQAFLWHRSLYGRLTSIYELQAIPTWDLETIRQLLPFVRVSNGQELPQANLGQSFLASGHQQFMLRYHQKLDTAPLPDSLQQGSPKGSWFMRLRSSYSKLYSIGITLAQDPQEPWKPNPNGPPRADFNSFHAIAYNQGKVKALALGDYQIQLGQSLLMAGGFQLGKGSESVTGMRRAHSGIRPYTSGMESGFLRGVAANYQLAPQLALTTWLSRQRIDAKIDTLEGVPLIASLPQTGLHTTTREMERRKVLPEQVYGANITYKHRHKPLILGLTGMHYELGLPFAPKPHLYQQSWPLSATKQYIAAHYSGQWRQWQLFGESGMQYDGNRLAMAHIAGILGGLGRSLQLALLARHYSPEFDSPFGQAIAESSTARNETGWYIGLQYSPNRRWRLNAYFDQFRFPWLRYRVDAPSSGYEQFLRLTYRPSRHSSLHIQYKEEKKPRNLRKEAQAFDWVMPGLKRQLQIHARLTLPMRLTLQARAQGGSFAQGDEPPKWGWTLHHEASWAKGRIKLSARILYFDAPEYDTRQYVYEKDVLYAFSFPAFYGQGIRQYALLKIRILRHLDAWVKYAQTTTYPRQKRARELKWQVLYKF